MKRGSMRLKVIGTFSPGCSMRGRTKHAYYTVAPSGIYSGAEAVENDSDAQNRYDNNRFTASSRVLHAYVQCVACRLFREKPGISSPKRFTRDIATHRR